MSIPEVNIMEVAGGDLWLVRELLDVQEKLGKGGLAFFLEIVPARGKELMKLFREFFLGNQSHKIGFVDFMLANIRQDQLKMFFPRECKREQRSRKLVLEDILLSCAPETKEDVFRIYFGDGAIYEKFRQALCVHCLRDDCQHKC